jgi:hypothetical protein
VDQYGTVLDILVTSRRDATAATRFFRKLLTRLEYVPRMLVTNKLGSYQAAQRRMLRSVEHRPSKYLNNRAAPTASPPAMPADCPPNRRPARSTSAFITKPIRARDRRNVRAVWCRAYRERVSHATSTGRTSADVGHTADRICSLTSRNAARAGSGRVTTGVDRLSAGGGKLEVVSHLRGRDTGHQVPRAVGRSQVTDGRAGLIRLP